MNSLFKPKSHFKEKRLIFEFKFQPLFEKRGELLMRTYIETKLFEEFSNKPSFSRDQLFRYYKTFEPELKEGTFGWRIYELKRKHMIKSVKKGIYAFVNKKEFKPELNQMILDIVSSYLCIPAPLYPCISVSLYLCISTL